MASEDQVARVSAGVPESDSKAEIARLRKALRHSQGRFLNINICLLSGGTKREAIAIADVGEDCIKMALGPQRVRVVSAADVA